MASSIKTNFFQYPPRRCPVDTAILITWQFAGVLGEDYFCMLCPLCRIQVCPECGEEGHPPNDKCPAYKRPVFAAHQETARLEHALRKAEYDVYVCGKMLQESDQIVDAANRYDNEHEGMIAGTKVVRYGNLSGIDDYGRTKRVVGVAKGELQTYRAGLKKYTMENGLAGLPLERREMLYSDFVDRQRERQVQENSAGF